MNNILLITGGVLQTLLAIFHIYLGILIYGNDKNLSPEVQDLLQIFNSVTLVTIIFFAYVSFFHRKKIQDTKLGKAVLLLICSFYFIRGLIEPVMNEPNYFILFFGVVIGLLYFKPLIRSGLTTSHL